MESYRPSPSHTTSNSPSTSSLASLPATVDASGLASLEDHGDDLLDDDDGWERVEPPQQEDAHEELEQAVGVDEAHAGSVSGGTGGHEEEERPRDEGDGDYNDEKRTGDPGWKGKGKELHNLDTKMYSSSGKAPVVDPRDLYLSPPLTNAPSEALLFGLDVSRVLTLPLPPLPDVEVDVDLGSPSESSTSSLSSRSRTVSSGSGDAHDRQEVGAEVDEAVTPSRSMSDDLSFEGSSFLSETTTTSRRESTTTRRATMGDTTLDSSAAEIPLPLPPPPPRVIRVPSPPLDDQEGARRSRFLREKEKWDDGHLRTYTHHRRRSTGEVAPKHGRRRRLRLVRREKSQERELSRDFFLIIILCFGLACAGILVLRPTAMALFGYGDLGGRLEVD